MPPDIRLMGDPSDLLKLCTSPEREYSGQEEFETDIAALGVRVPVEIHVSVDDSLCESWTIPDGLRRLCAARDAGQRYVPICVFVGEIHS